MKFAIAVLGLCCTIVAAKQVNGPQRIIGGSVTTIDRYPYMVNMMSNDQGYLGVYRQWCAGSLLTSRSVLSAAHCYTRNNGFPHATDWWRVSIGSHFANLGNLVYRVRQFIRHPNYNYFSGSNNDIVVIETTAAMALGGNVQVASISGTNYNLPDNAPVWAIGWGVTTPGGQPSVQLREVQLWTINRDVCRQRYSSALVTDNMICSGWLDVGGRDQCQGDSGGPLIHNGVVVGLSSWGWGCASPYYPGVNTRVSSYTNWILGVVDSLSAA